MDGVPRSGTRIVYEDRSVTFRHQDSIWSGVSRTDTRGIKIMYLERCTQFNEPNSQMSMMGRRESSLMCFVL